MAAKAADVAELKPEVVAACREWLPFEQFEELMRLYAAVREQWCGEGAGGDHKRSGRRGLQREVSGDKVEAAQCLERKAEELDRLAETAAVEAAREAAGLRIEVAKFRRLTMERWEAAVQLVSRFETAAWPALEAGGQICVVEAKLRNANLVEALLSDWKAFSSLSEASDDEADQLPSMYSDGSRAAEAAERLGLLVEISGGVVGADRSVTLAAIERQAKRLERQLVSQLLFAAALRDDDEREATSSTKPVFRSRDEDAMVVAAEALDKLRQPRAGLGHLEWRDAVLQRVHTCWRRELKARPGSRDLDCAIAAARSVLCGGSGELAATIRVVLRATRQAKREHRLVDVRAATRALMQGLVDQLGLKNAVLDVLANADYEDADAADQLSQLSTKYLDAIAELAATIDKLRRALERTVDEALLGTSASYSIDRKQQDDDHDDDDANDEKVIDAPRELGADDAPMFAEAAKREISAATNSLLEAARAGYARREADWLEAALVVAGRELASATTNVDCTDRADSNSGSNSALFGRPWRRRRQRPGREEEDEASDDEASSRKVLGSEAAVPTDASLSALLRISLARSNFETARASLAASLKRCVAVLPHRGADIASSDYRALAREAVLGVLDRKGGHDDAIRRAPPGRSASTSLPSADDISRDIVGRARRFAYHDVLRPAVRVAKARITEIHSACPLHKVKPAGLFSSSSSSASYNQARRDQAGDEPLGSPPRAFFDVVVAVLDAEARWRTLEAVLLESHAPNDVELREGASASLRSDLGDALRAAQAFFADILAAKLPTIANPLKHDYAIATEPVKLQPTRPVADICAALKAHAQAVAAILRTNPGEKPDAPEQNRAKDIVAMLAARWRIALASDVFRAFTHYVDNLRITPAGAFVLSRDLDELRAAVAELGCTTTDANFLQLRENCALLKLDKSDLKRLLLYDTTDTFSQDKAKLSNILLTRADAWSRTGAKLPWVEDLIEELHLPADARYGL